VARVLIIAEAGVNHNGRLDLARRMIDEARAAGADAVKFQTFITTDCITRGAAKAEYQAVNDGAGESQFDMVRRLELSFGDFEKLKQACVGAGILFSSTPFDLASVDFLHRLGCPFWKVASGEITNLPLLRRIARHGGPVIMSTGMATLDEVDGARRVLVSNGIREDDLTLLHCHTDYPTRFEEANLRAMGALKAAFPRCHVGFSDHTPGVEAAVAAVALGAEVVEKHFTLDRELPGPDHRASLVPSELACLVRSIRNVEAALGDGVKRPSEAELKIREVARKSLVAARPIRRGERFSEENLAVKRPGGGVDPMRWDDYVGRSATREYGKDEPIDA